MPVQPAYGSGVLDAVALASSKLMPYNETEVDKVARTKWGVMHVFVLAFFITQANANVFIVDYTKVDKLPVVTVTVKDKNGNDTQVSAVVDSGNSDGIVVSKAVATNLGLADLGAASANGIGGTSAVKNTTFTGDKALKLNNVSTPSGQAQTTLTISGSGMIIDGLPVDMLIGQSFLDSYVQTFNPKDKKLTLTDLAQLEKKPEVKPKEADIKKIEENKGTLNIIDGIDGPSWGVDVRLALGGTSTESEFVIATGATISLISEATAYGLGIDISGLQQRSLTTSLGVINIGEILLGFQLFADDPFSTSLFGVVPNQYNPGGINVLGSDILDTLGLFQIDIADQKLRAIPLPGSIMLLGVGLLGLIYRRYRDA